MKNNKFQQGSITPAILIGVGSVLLILYSLLVVLALQLENSNRQTSSEQALYIAESGINYYRWHLAHDPSDFKDGTTSSGPYRHVYTDPQGDVIGEYDLSLTPPENGSSVVTITTTGWSNRYPSVKRTIKAQYGIPSLASFAFLQHASSWYGSGITVNGPVHSNTGIRMDGVNNSLVTSGVQTYTCGSETGCSTPTTKPGVWGNGPNKNLWKFQVPSIDFDTISFDFSTMKDEADAHGLHLYPSTKSGYHLIFNANGTVTIRKVTGTNYTYGYWIPYDGDGHSSCDKLYQYITSETDVGTYQLSSSPIIFIEDKIWVEGTVRGRTTVAAVRFPIETSKTDIWIPNNITYTTLNGSDVLGLIAQSNIYFGRQIPDNFRIDAALMAQHGTIIRHRYYSSCGGTSQALKNSLTLYGSVISYYKSYWNYGDPPSSGFRTRTITFDPNLTYSPPPYFPTSGEYQFISWLEE